MSQALTTQQRNNIGNSLIFMIRYAMSRRTSADMASNTALKSLWDEISETHKKIILKEIEAERDTHEDFWLWEDFLVFARKSKQTSGGVPSK